MEKPEVLFQGVLVTAVFCLAQRGEGKVFGHPKIPDGNFVHTSEVVKTGDGWFETENTKYVIVD